MNVIIKIFFIAGFSFWGLGLLYSFSKLIALNGLGNTFVMKEAENAKLETTRDTSFITVFYSYQIGEKVYNDNYKMYQDYFQRCNVDTLVVKYNKFFPMISYIDGVPLKIRKQKTGIFMSTFFLLILILLWKLNNKNNYIKTYEEVGNRPWLYEEDKSIKNPWLRFKSRLFRK